MLAIASLLVALTLTQAAPAAEQTGRASGRVTVEGANTPVSGARVLLIPTTRPTAPMGPPPQAMTDQDGRFGFDRVAPGTYRLDVQKTGLVPLDSRRAPEVTVAAGQSIDHINQQMQKGGVITGRLLDATGEPIPDARMMVFRRPPANPRMPATFRLMPAPNPGTQTNDIGEFRLSGLATGEYFVAAMPRPSMVFGGSGSDPTASHSPVRSALPTTYYPGTIEQAAAMPIIVTAGAEVGNISFAVQPVPAFRVSGIVVDEEGKPLAGAMVTLIADPRTGAFSGPAGTGRARGDGRFEIDGVVAGAYRANAAVPMAMNGAGGVTSGVVAGVSGGIAMSGPSGGVVTWSSGPMSTMDQVPDVVVGDADVSGIRVVARRPSRQ
jgi:protocatechuate 3,4-dioxygenase beta subunit